MPVLEKKLSEEVDKSVHEGKKTNSINIKEVLNEVSLQYWRNIETNEMPVIKNEVLEESNEMIHDNTMHHCLDFSIAMQKRVKKTVKQAQLI